MYVFVTDGLFIKVDGQRFILMLYTILFTKTIHLLSEKFAESNI